MKQIVAISDKRDAHIALVQKHLSQPIIIIDPQAALQKSGLSFVLENQKIVVIYEGEQLDNVSGVWFRKPLDVTAEQIPTDKSWRGYAITAMQSHFALVLSAFQDALWVSDYYAMRRASNKALQLEVAARLGFNVPATVFASDPEVAKTFIEAHEQCIVKTNAAIIPPKNGPKKSFFTTRINKKSPPNLENLHLAPAIFQEAIDTKLDIRVTVMGDKVFAATIENNELPGNSAILDWRIGHYEGDMKIKEYFLPSPIEKQCVALVKDLGLHYGAIDLVLDKKGKIWFLENNPGGQWGFVEQATGQPMAETMAKLLQG